MDSWAPGLFNVWIQARIDIVILEWGALTFQNVWALSFWDAHFVSPFVFDNWNDANYVLSSIFSN